MAHGRSYRTAAEIRATAPAFAHHARTTVQRGHRQPGIVSDGWTTAQSSEIAGLRERILLERRVHLERIFIIRLGNAGVVEIDDPDAAPRSLMR